MYHGQGINVATKSKVTFIFKTRLYYNECTPDRDRSNISVFGSHHFPPYTALKKIEEKIA